MNRQTCVRVQDSPRRRYFADSALVVGVEIVLVIVFVLMAGYLARAFAQNKISLQITGEAIVLVADDFENNRSETQYYIRDAKTGKAQAVQFLDGAPQQFRTGAQVAATGVQNGQQITLHNTDVQIKAAATSPQMTATVNLPTTPSTPVIFHQNVLVVLVNDIDQSVACTTTTCNSNVFGATNSVQSLYAETARGNATYAGRVVGPYAISARTTDSCPSPYLPVLEGWAALADAQAAKAGVDVSSYTEKVYVMPATNPCGNQRGYAMIGGSPSMAWIFQCRDPEVYAHEMGHNLGMMHASTLTSDYGDESDIMGVTTIGLRDLAAPHRDEFGWIPANKIVNVTAGGTYTIAPLEVLPGNTTLPQTLKIPKTDTNESYYFSFRQPLGIDAILPTFNAGLYTNGVSVHRFAGANVNNVHTYFLQGLTDGTAFTDNVNHITVTQLSHSASGAQVRVSLGTARASLTPAALSFGSFKVGGHTAPLSATLSNGSGIAMSISSVGITGVNASDFLVASNSCGTSLAAGASCTIGVTFRPITAGSRSSFLAVADAVGTQEVSLSGTALNPLGFSSQSFAFPTELLNSKSALANFTVANTGNSSVSLTKFATTGPFAISANTCGTALGAHASCVVSVAFTPTAVGVVNGTLQVWGSASSTPAAVNLSGTGTQVSLTPNPISFTSQTVGTNAAVTVLTFANRGTAAVGITAIAVTGDFSIASKTCGTSVGAGATCSVSIGFHPTAIGVRTGTLKITDSAGGSPQSVALNGTGQ